MTPSYFVLHIDYGHGIGLGEVVAKQNRASLVNEIHQFDRVLRVVEVNEDEGWVRDVSEDLAHDIAAKREPVSRDVLDFIGRHGGLALQNACREAA